MSDLYTEFTQDLTPPGGDNILLKEDLDMFGSNQSEEKKATGNYTFTVEKARATKNDKIVMLNLDVNGVKISGAMLKEVTVSKDTKKYKKGDTAYILSFPNYKGSDDNWYNHCWAPVSEDNLKSVIDQTKTLLSAK